MEDANCDLQFTNQFILVLFERSERCIKFTKKK
jgi:hypothetical protein